jgi:hypothetical protein
MITIARPKNCGTCGAQNIVEIFQGFVKSNIKFAWTNMARNRSKSNTFSRNHHENKWENVVIKMGRVGFEPTNPAMSRRYLNQARPPAPYTACLNFLISLNIYSPIRLKTSLKTMYYKDFMGSMI